MIDQYWQVSVSLYSKIVFSMPYGAKLQRTEKSASIISLRTVNSLWKWGKERSLYYKLTWMQTGIAHDLEVGCWTVSFTKSVRSRISRRGKRYRATKSTSVYLSSGLIRSRKTRSRRNARSFSKRRKKAAIFVVN